MLHEPSIQSCCHCVGDSSEALRFSFQAAFILPCSPEKNSLVVYTCLLLESAGMHPNGITLWTSLSSKESLAEKAFDISTSTFPSSFFFEREWWWGLLLSTRGRQAAGGHPARLGLGRRGAGPCGLWPAVEGGVKAENREDPRQTAWGMAGGAGPGRA
jgi:hypothetical protein